MTGNRPLRWVPLIAAALVFGFLALDSDKTDGWMSVLVEAAFIAGPLMLAACTLPASKTWAVFQTVLFGGLTTFAFLVADAKSSTESTAGIWLPTVAVLQYLLLIAIIIGRLGKRAAAGLRRS